LTKTSIIFVRHGEVYNPEAIYYGRLPRFRLSENGRQQAQTAAESLGDKPIAAIYSSPMLRARQTAEIIRSFHPAVPLHITNLLQEVYTPFDGLTHLELEAREWDLYTDTPAHYETPQDVLARVQKFIGRTRKRHPGKRTVAVTHGDVICFLLLWLDCRPVSVTARVHIPAICVTDEYPAPASFVELIYTSNSPDELPEFTYVKPYK
jgi:broad specificity phosphatase PhoE